MSNPLPKIIALGIFIIAMAIMSVSAAVPGMMTYQGRLTDEAGQPVSDATYALTFKIYADSAMSIMPALWTESQDVTTNGGLFTVLLGKNVPIPQETFDGTTRYLGITIVGETEFQPRTPLVSVPYAMVAGNAAGSIDCSDCDIRFINAIGPDELTATSDTAFKVANSGPEAYLGIRSILETNTSEQVASVFGTTRASGEGTSHGGVFDAISTGTGLTYGVTATAENNTTMYGAVGVHGMAKNSGSADAIGGVFEAFSNGSGPHIGSHSSAIGVSNNECLGVRGQAYNYTNGKCFGGHFIASSTDQKAYGVWASADASSDSSIYGVYSKADNSGTGTTYGGYFKADSTAQSPQVGLYSTALDGNQYSYGLISLAEADHQFGHAYGYFGDAKNKANGLSCGGIFQAESEGYEAQGCRGYGSVRNTGSAYGGRFFAFSLDGYSYGVYAEADEFLGTQRKATGIYGLSRGLISEGGYGGYFKSIATGASQYGLYSIADGANNQPQYGTYSMAQNATGSQSSFGVYGRSEHQGTGNSYGGYFLADTTGTGSSYGVRSVGSGFSTAATYGIASYGANRSSGLVYGGFFEIGNFGTGTRYAVYGKSPTSGYAGYFEGHVRVTGNQTVVGTKSAAVKIDDDDYRLVYCQESPENWFEDFGEGQLINGRVHIELDPVYLRTVTIDDKNPMKVFIQLNDPECNGTAVIRGITGFDVVELQNGTGNASFSYRVVAKRRGYEDLRLEPLPGLTPEQVAEQTEAESAAMQTAEAAIETQIAQHKELDANSEQVTQSVLRPIID